MVHQCDAEYLSVVGSRKECDVKAHRNRADDCNKSPAVIRRVSDTVFSVGPDTFVLSW